MRTRCGRGCKTDGRWNGRWLVKRCSPQDSPTVKILCFLHDGQETLPHFPSRNTAAESPRSCVDIKRRLRHYYGRIMSGISALSSKRRAERALSEQQPRNMLRHFVLFSNFRHFFRFRPHIAPLLFLLFPSLMFSNRPKVLYSFYLFFFLFHFCFWLSSPCLSPFAFHCYLCYYCFIFYSNYLVLYNNISFFFLNFCMTQSLQYFTKESIHFRVLRFDLLRCGVFSILYILT